MDYTGYKVLRLDDDVLSQLYTYGNLGAGAPEFLVNEYLIATDKDDNPVDYFRYTTDGIFVRVPFLTISSNRGEKLKPRNQEQRIAFDLMKNKDIPVKLLTGTWGAGKTIALIGQAMEDLEAGVFEKITWVRNNVQVKDTDALGALPGSSESKMLPYVMPFADHCGGTEAVEQMIELGFLEVIPLGFLRGRSIRNSVILCSEAENLTKQHIQLLLGRLDTGSQLWFDADVRQRDREAFVKSAGIETMVERLKGNPLFGYVHLQKSERSPASRLADLLND